MIHIYNNAADLYNTTKYMYYITTYSDFDN